MTTDPDEGRRQIEAMQPDPIKVGDKVKLVAGGERIMIVVDLLDYDNMVVCECVGPVRSPGDGEEHTRTWREAFPIRSLIKADARPDDASAA